MMGEHFALSASEHWWCFGVAAFIAVVMLLIIVAVRTGETNPFKRFYQYGDVFDNLLFYGLFLLISIGLSAAFYAVISFVIIFNKYF